MARSPGTQRLVIEESLKAGRLPALVATSSLELGIDMGAVDLVVQIETPPSVASGMQRIGRASHTAEAVSRGIIFPKYRGDLLSTAAITRAMTEGAVEETRIPANPLDVLAQQLVALCATGSQKVDDVFALVRRAAPFTGLPRAQFEGVLDMLSGRYPSDDFRELRPRLTWDRLRGTVRAREGALRLAVTNAGTIPDRGLFGVFLAEGAAGTPGSRPGGGRRVGELDEEMVFESRIGDRFVLGASSWRIVEITRDRVLVEPAPGEPGRMPFWKADRGARPVELGRRIGELTRQLLAQPAAKAHARLVEQHALDPQAAENLLAYLREQKEATGAVPDDRTIVLERTRDEMGDWRLCLLSPWGGRVHAPWSLALEARLKRTGNVEVETIWSDDGLVMRLPDRDRPPDASDLLPEPEEIEDLVVEELGGSALFAAHFREAAGRALLLPRRKPGQRTPLWMQRKRAGDLMKVAAQYPSFPIVLEAYRECLKDVFDLPALVELARKVRRREVRLVTVNTDSPSPFSSSLLFGYVANYLYEGDAPLAERRAQALSVDQRQLRELMGEAELRELLDADALAELEETLLGLSAAQRLKSADRVHDLLLRTGDLTLQEIATRVQASEPTGSPLAQAREWLDSLAAERRVIRVRLAGEERFAAAEDAARLRDGLGVQPPQELPLAFLEPEPHALRDLVARYTRTHGPFSSVDVARRLGCGTGPAETALRELLAEGRVALGEFRPGGSGREWVSPDVLASLRQRSLAKLRRQVAPAEPEALARTLLDWQGVVTRPELASAPSRRGPDALLDVLEQLQRTSLIASALERDVLPARLPGYRPGDLDALCAAGDVVWVGLAPLGDRDGRLALYLADDFPLLHEASTDRPKGDLHDRLRDHLETHGASFFAELHVAAGGGLEKEVLDALWDLVWAGEVTNDTPAALRAFLQQRASRRDRSSRRLQAFRSRRHAPPSAAGRWSLVPGSRGAKPPTPTERLLALAEQLLARHGVLTRDAIAAEGVVGGFATLYPVLRTLEESGRIRRGYFVRGLGGSQFAHAGALERLRALREPGSGDDDETAAAVVLASTDPANPYGGALPWPAGEGARPMRVAGTHVVLVDGALAAYLGRGEKELRTWVPADEPQRSRVLHGVAEALGAWAARTHQATLGWATADTRPLAHSPLAPFLLEAGFVRSGPGFRYAGPTPEAAETGEGEAQKES